MGGVVPMLALNQNCPNRHNRPHNVGLQWCILLIFWYHDITTFWNFKNFILLFAAISIHSAKGFQLQKRSIFHLHGFQSVSVVLATNYPKISTEFFKMRYTIYYHFALRKKHNKFRLHLVFGFSFSFTKEKFSVYLPLPLQISSESDAPDRHRFTPLF